MFRHAISLVCNEDGAVTVDWVVLTASLVGLGMAVAFGVSTGFRTQSTSLEQGLQQDHISTTFQTPGVQSPQGVDPALADEDR